MAHKKLKTHRVGILFNLQLHGSLTSPSYCAQIRTCCSWTRTTTAGPACAASRRQRRPARHSTRPAFSLSTRRTCGHRSARRPLTLRAHAAAATPAFGLSSQVFVLKNVSVLYLFSTFNQHVSLIVQASSCCSTRYLRSCAPLRTSASCLSRTTRRLSTSANDSARCASV